ncbi:hypothetical protein [Flavivirga rizhaonensis]|uniref:DUF304 domain-containing protein n=1 Tax=Flavivirga rizhaonensis TaxID=2559571 RepID=A0A4S1DT80_9FLAO|nr:hypothetical protein [Flavivirga rizhaonensis]TGV01240.1 hypothetical protein EM932_16510 [Flavivirga rizhaonensis]
MKSYEISNNQLTLRIKRSPVFVRSIMFLFTFLFFFSPLIGIALFISTGYRFHIGFLVWMGLFGLMGFYMLRVSLWNTYGYETIHFNEQKVTYEANYGWFKDGKKTKEISPLKFSIKQVGYKEDKKGTLIIGTEDSYIECVTKMPIHEIKELIEKLESSH